MKLCCHVMIVCIQVVEDLQRSNLELASELFPPSLCSAARELQ